MNAGKLRQRVSMHDALLLVKREEDRLIRLPIPSLRSQRGYVFWYAWACEHRVPLHTKRDKDPTTDHVRKTFARMCVLLFPRSTDPGTRWTKQCRGRAADLPDARIPS